MIKKKHIVFLTPGFPANEKDTTCIPALYIYANELAKEPDIKITVIATHYPYFSKSYNWNGTDVIAIGTRQNTFSKAISFFKINRVLKKLHKQEKIDHIHCFWLSRISLIANKFCLKNEMPLTLTFMGRDALPINKSIKKTKSLKANFVTLSQFHDKILKENVNTIETKIINWGLESEVATNETGTNERSIDIICVGGFSEVKNLFNFIEIIERVKATKPDIKVKMVGGGILEKEMKDVIRDKNLVSTIEITGMIAREEVLKIMSATKILLHTSSYESFGLVLIEGLARGCKVMSYPVGIAYENENISTANATDELVELVIKKLDDTKFECITDLKISDTVKNYKSVYGL